MFAGFWLPANMLTISRILVVPLILACWLVEMPYGKAISLLLFVLAGLTDLFDGLLARNRNEETHLGAFLDPVADKILTVAVLLLLLQHFTPPAILLLIPVVIIVSREIAVSALRELAGRLSRQADLQVISLAKGKTFLEFVAISGLMLAGVSDFPWQKVIFLGSVLGIYLTALLSLVTLFQYVQKVRQWRLASDEPPE